MKLTNNLSIEAQMKTYANCGFTPAQLELIQNGLKAGINVSAYTFPQYDILMMMLLFEIMMHDNDFNINDFSENNELNVWQLLNHHDAIAQECGRLARFGSSAIDQILQGAPYYTSY